MLQDENSAYYDLLQNTVKHTNIDRLYTFGMNLGYNGCTVGAQRLRSHEKRMACNIPWSLSLQIDPQKMQKSYEKYDALISDGESLGIFTWMLFPDGFVQTVLPLAKAHPDSAFCIFCDFKDITDVLLDEAMDVYNIMFAVRYEEDAANRISILRERGFLYSVWYQYGEKDMEMILNEVLFQKVQQFTPAFTVLVPSETCPKEMRRLAYQAVTRVRKGQSYPTIILELQRDNNAIDSIISNNAYSVYFDKDGYLRDWDKNTGSEQYNLFQYRLPDILLNGWPKETVQRI